MLPLAGVRVIAVEQYGAGPFGSMLLADLGAEVIKIENPKEGGDISRAVGPHFFGPNDSQFFHAFNRNKKSLTLDLKHAESRGVLRRLVAEADALLGNLRGDLPERLGLTYDALKDANPRLVCAHLSAYGREGPRRAWPGYDYLMQAEAGFLSVTGEPDGPPVRFGLSVVDFMTGLAAAFALLAGVIGARASGVGRDIDVSLFDIALHNLSYLATWYLNAGHVQGREKRGAHPSLTPSQLFHTKDGWIFLMCNKEKFWRLLAERLGHPEWLEDPRFVDFPARLENRDALTALIDAALSARTTAEWMELFAGELPAAPVHDIAQALENPFVTEQGRLAEFPGPDGSPRRGLTSPFRLAEPLPMRPAPALGADSEAILRALGYTAEEIARLRACGAV